MKFIIHCGDGYEYCHDDESMSGYSTSCLNSKCRQLEKDGFLICDRNDSEVAVFKNFVKSINIK